jgi:hypothetical protein
MCALVEPWRRVGRGDSGDQWPAVTPSYLGVRVLSVQQPLCWSQAQCYAPNCELTSALFPQGRGYSLPASIQLLDARHGPDAAVSIYLLRDISNKELALLCRHRGIQCKSMLVLPAHARSSINQLAEAFIENLQVTCWHVLVCAAPPNTAGAAVQG